MRAVATILLAVAGGCVGAHKHRALQASYDDLQERYDALAAQTRDMRALVDAMQAALRTAEGEDRGEPRPSFFDELLAAFRPHLEAEEVAVMVYPDRLTLALADGVHFETGSAALTEDGMAVIDALASVLQDHPERRFVVEGHTDSVPIRTERYPSNWELGAARSVSVVEALRSAGISADRLSAASFADTEPLATNESMAGRARNRRVEISFQPTLEEVPGYERLVEAAERVIRAEGAPDLPVSDAVSGAEPGS